MPAHSADNRTLRSMPLASFIFLLLLIPAWLPFGASAAVTPPTNYDYQIATPHTLQQPEQPSDLLDGESPRSDCQAECEEGGAAACLRCLRFINAGVLADRPEATADEGAKVAIPVAEMDRIISPLLWSSSLRTDGGRWPRAERLLERLRQAGTVGSRPHKKDLRVALQRSLNEHDINSLLRNTWVGR
ncbi:hypothetical protein M3Y99_00566000 [Aphelenchoides fujianensis]|nr:hypothetical protein M3Y99_00566000 [Aphelenchoides fujianensis]